MQLISPQILIWDNSSLIVWTLISINACFDGQLMGKLQCMPAGCCTVLLTHPISPHSELVLQKGSRFREVTSPGQVIRLQSGRTHGSNSGVALTQAYIFACQLPMHCTRPAELVLPAG